MGVKLLKLRSAAESEILKGVFASDESIARKAGITYRTYQTAKSGMPVSVGTAMKIAHALKVKLVDLQTDEGQ
jgi:hypothetical protein